MRRPFAALRRILPMSPDTAQSPIIHLEHVSLRFGQQEVLRDIDLAIERRRTTAIIGESGCGKTVLLKLIIGLLRPTSGVVRLDGRVLSEMSERELNRARLRFGFLFQQAALFDSLSVFDNVAFPLREHTPKKESEIAEVIRQRLQEVDLPWEAASKGPAELSGGMRKRVGLARALALNPEVMLYDEPTTGLDPIMSDVIAELILQTAARHEITAVVVTHDLKIVEKVADRIVMLYPLARLGPTESQIVFDGTRQELRSSSDPRVMQFVRGEAGERLLKTQT